VKQLQPVLTAIDLLDAGDFHAAYRLYRERLEDGRIFNWLPAPAEGQHCALGFVRDTERRGACERALERLGLSFIAERVGLFAKEGGEFAEALLFLRDGVPRDAIRLTAKQMT
jgi:hypothetical protein